MKKPALRMMTNKNESREDCIAAIKECIKDDLQKPEIIKKND